MKKLENRTFTDLIKAVNDAANNAATLNDPALGANIQELSAAVALSVLKKCYNVSGLKLLLNLKSDIIHFLADMGRKPLLEQSEKWVYNANGELEHESADPISKAALDRLTASAIGDGVDLVQQAALTLLDEIGKQRENGASVDLERPYTVRRPRQRVRTWAQVQEPEWIETETTPIQESYRAVRRMVTVSGSVRLDPSNMHTYINDIITDPETGATADGYSRLLPMADLGSYAVNSNGERAGYTVGEDVAERIYTIIENMKLTKVQTQVLYLRLQGKSKSEIAKAIKRSPNTVTSAIRVIQEKAIKINLK